MTDQQHLGEWNIPLSEPSCFSCNHNIKGIQCLFLTMVQLVRVADNNALLFEKKIYVKVYYALYGYCIMVRRSYPKKHFSL